MIVHTKHYFTLSLLFLALFYGVCAWNLPLVDVCERQLTSSSTRVRIWTPLLSHECVMSKEECWYNKALYCSSAFASVHHTDEYVWTTSEEPQWVRALAPLFWTFNLLSDFSQTDVNRKDCFFHYQKQWVLKFLCFCRGSFCRNRLFYFFLPRTLAFTV